MKRLLAAAVAAVILLAACGSEPSMADYAAAVEELVVGMNERLDALEAESDAAPSLEATKRYATRRSEARADFVAGLDRLDPPPDAMELHETALGIMERVAAAEAALANRVQTLTTDIGISAIWNTPEGISARAVDQAAISLCLSAQSQFDQTQLRAELGDVPWVPPEMKQVVIVTLGCIAEER